MRILIKLTLLFGLALSVNTYASEQLEGYSANEADSEINWATMNNSLNSNPAITDEDMGVLEESSFGVLPNEIIELILHQKGAAKDLYSTCHYFRKLGQQSKKIFFKPLTEQMFEENVELPDTYQMKEFTPYIGMLYTLRFVRNLDLSQTTVLDVSMLSEVECLEIWGCDNVTDVSMLINVRKLALDRTEFTQENIDKLLENNPGVEIIQ